MKKLKVLIGGIGNVLLGDDGVGPYVAHLLNACYEFDSAVEIEDLGTPALDLIDRISAKDTVILIDSIDVEAKPGSVLPYRKADIMRLRPAVRMDPHAPALVDALLSAELFSVCPEEVLLVGIKAQSFEQGCSLSEPVQGALLETISVILKELDRLGVEYKVRECPAELDTWWSSESPLELSTC